LTQDRDGVFRALRAEGIGVNVHYFPVHLHPFYRQRFATHAGLCPVAERVFREIVTLPLFPAMTDEDVSDVIIALHKVIGAYRK
jgi:perosamine synthetase